MGINSSYFKGFGPTLDRIKFSTIQEFVKDYTFVQLKKAYEKHGIEKFAKKRDELKAISPE